MVQSSADGAIATSSDQTFTTAAAPPDTTPPAVTITRPSSGSYATSTAFVLTATSTDNVGVTGVQFKVDGNPVGAIGSSSPYSISWNSTSVADGSHSIVAVANDVAGNYATSTAVTVTVDNTPPVISSVTAAALRGTSATITWTTNNLADSQVAYGTTASYGLLTTLSTTTVTNHSVSLSGLTTSTTYHYQVISHDIAGNAATSTDQTFTTTNGLNDVPFTPINLVATPVSDTEINLTWDRVNTGETGISIYRANGTNTSYAKVITLPSGSNIFTDTSLYASSTYSFVLTADNAAGSSATSTSVTSTTMGGQGQVPTPTNLVASSTSPFTITLNWIDNALGSGSHDFPIERSPDGVHYSVIADISSTGSSANSYIDTPLLPSTTYYYRTRAVTGSYYSNYSSPTSTTTQARVSGTPIEPTNLSATVNSATSTTLNWTDTNNGSVSYLIETTSFYYTTPAWTQIATTSIGATSYTLTTSAETATYVRIRAANSTGDSGYTPQIIFRSASNGTGSPKVYNIGPNQTYSSLGSLNWAQLGPGDTVNIYPNKDINGNVIPYYEKPLIAVRGTSVAPITIRGIPDSVTGALPIIDAANAIENSQWQSHYVPLQDDSLILIGTRANNNSSGYSPGYLNISNLEVRNAYQDSTHPLNYTASDGTTRAYTFPCGIYIEKGDHILLKGLIVHGNNEGIFAAGQGDARNLEEITFDSNYIYGNGTINNYGTHNTYIEGINDIYQFNKYGPLLPGATGTGLKDRGAGTIIRYNFFQGGGHLLDIVEAQNYAYTTLTLPSYYKTYVYGNILYNPAGGPNGAATTPIYYGVDTLSGASSRKGVLYFYNNTFYTQAQYYENLFDTPTGADNIDARNNIIKLEPNPVTGAELDLLTNVGVGYFGNNWMSSTWVTNRTGNVFTGHIAGTSNFINNAQNDPGYVSTSSPDFHLISSSQAIGQSSTLWGDALPVQYAYAEPTASTTRTTSHDLGAYEYIGADVTPPTISISAPSIGITLSGTTTVAATATDNVGVVGVQFLLDGANLGSLLTNSPYIYTLNTATISNGSHTLVAVAHDGASNYATSSATTFAVSNIGGRTGSSLSATTINYTANVGTSVSFSSSVTGGTSPYTYLWNFGDGATTTGATPSHIYNSAGIYNAVVTVTDASSAIAYATSTVTVNTISSGGGGGVSISSGGGGGYYLPLVTTSSTTTPVIISTTTPSVSTTTPPVTPILQHGLIPAGIIFTRNLKLGMKGNDILELQRFLNSNGYLISLKGAGSVGHESTYFGLATKAALIRFQKAQHIVPSYGFFGILTRTFINNLRLGNVSPSQNITTREKVMLIIAQVEALLPQAKTQDQINQLAAILSTAQKLLGGK